MKLRGPVLVVAAIGIPVALLLLVLPMTWGYGGYRWNPTGATGTLDNGVVSYVDPSGPAARAGLREGDHITTMEDAAASINEIAGPVGTVVRYTILRDGRSKPITISFVPYSGTLGAQQQLSKILSALTAACAFVTIILILLRGRDRDLAARASFVLLFAGLGALSQGLALVSYYGAAAALFYRWLPPLFLSFTLYAALSLLVVFPREGVAFRKLLLRLGIAGVFLAVAYVADDIAFSLRMTNGSNPWWLLAPFLPLVAVSIVHAMARARDAQAVPMRWLGTMWLIGLAVKSVPFVLRLAHMPIGVSHYFDVVDSLLVFFLAFGVAYPILRHRMIDLNILVSRATVFTVVSLIIVCIFVAVEWAVGKIFEQSFGFSNERGGLAAQIVTLTVVLLLGLSARSIHAFVEERLTKVFFRSRLAAIAEVELVAKESDASTDADAVIRLAVDTVQRCFQPLGVALYLREGEGYECTRHAGAMAFARAYGYNDAVPLRLRRWLEPFDYAAAPDAQRVLFLPMSLRGDVLGFIACGPKPDHTAYLPDEVAALVRLAHHTGIAFACLSRAIPVPVLTLAPNS